MAGRKMSGTEEREEGKERGQEEERERVDKEMKGGGRRGR